MFNVKSFGLDVTSYLIFLKVPVLIFYENLCICGSWKSLQHTLAIESRSGFNIPYTGRVSDNFLSHTVSMPEHDGIWCGCAASELEPGRGQHVHCHLC
jgi:hypothetical protein